MKSAVNFYVCLVENLWETFPFGHDERESQKITRVSDYVFLEKAEST